MYQFRIIVPRPARPCFTSECLGFVSQNRPSDPGSPVGFVSQNGSLGLGVPIGFVSQNRPPTLDSRLSTLWPRLLLSLSCLLGMFLRASPAAAQSAPTAVEAIAAGPTEVRVYWDSVPGAVKYTVYRDDA